MPRVPSPNCFYLYRHAQFFALLGFGLASHLGVLSGIPCVGVGKKLFHTDGLKRGPEHREKVRVNARVGKILVGVCADCVTTVIE